MSAFWLSKDIFEADLNVVVQVVWISVLGHFTSFPLSLGK
jgi:hypothetical protein